MHINDYCSSATRLAGGRANERQADEQKRNFSAACESAATTTTKWRRMRELSERRSALVALFAYDNARSSHRLGGSSLVSSLVVAAAIAVALFANLLIARISVDRPARAQPTSRRVAHDAEAWRKSPKLLAIFFALRAIKGDSDGVSGADARPRACRRALLVDRRDLDERGIVFLFVAAAALVVAVAATAAAGARASTRQRFFERKVRSLTRARPLD